MPTLHATDRDSEKAIMSNTSNPVSLNRRRIAKAIKLKRSNQRRSHQGRTVKWFHRARTQMKKTKQQNQSLQLDSKEPNKERSLQPRRTLKPRKKRRLQSTMKTRMRVNLLKSSLRMNHQKKRKLLSREELWKLSQQLVAEVKPLQFVARELFPKILMTSLTKAVKKKRHLGNGMSTATFARMVATWCVAMVANKLLTFPA